jgi:hypothetical protein
VPIPFDDIFPGQDNVLRGNLDVEIQFDHAGNRDKGGDGPNLDSVVIFHNLGFPQKYQNHRSPHGADRERLIVAI